MYRKDEIAIKKVAAIILKNGQIGVSYYVSPYSGNSEEATVYRCDKPHEDFMEAFAPIPEIAKEWLELNLINADGDKLLFRVDKIKFIESTKKGFGVKMMCHAYDLKYSDEAIKLSTPTYYSYGNGNGTDKTGKKYVKQLLSDDEHLKFKRLAEEAFKYAYWGKREQPTAEEAAEAERSGGFLDEGDAD